jgi:hypothetical protein
MYLYDLIKKYLKDKSYREILFEYIKQIKLDQLNYDYGCLDYDYEPIDLLPETREMIENINPYHINSDGSYKVLKDTSKSYNYYIYKKDINYSQFI